MGDGMTRFSDRVADYVATRPSYPAEAIDAIYQLARVPTDCLIADVGAGTAISSALLVARGSRVIGIEPNNAMRNAGEALLAGESRYQAIAGTAEETGLEADSVDLVVAAQAFHWFDREKARREFARILTGKKPVALMWNDRRTEGSAFLEEYEAILMSLGTDYATVNHRHISAQGGSVIESFFASPVDKFTCQNTQSLNETSLIGRAFSSSYTPSPNDPGRQKMEQRLRALFAQTQNTGTVQMVYETQVYVGWLSR